MVSLHSYILKKKNPLFVWYFITYKSSHISHVTFTESKYFHHLTWEYWSLSQVILLVMGSFRNRTWDLWAQYSFFPYTKPPLSIKDFDPKHFYLFRKKIFFKSTTKIHRRYKITHHQSLTGGTLISGVTESGLSMFSTTWVCSTPTQSLPHSFPTKSSALQERQDNTLPQTWINDLTKWNRLFWKLTWVQADSILWLGTGNGILRSQNWDSCYETNNTKYCNFRKVCKRLLIGYVQTISGWKLHTENLNTRNPFEL